MLAIYLHHWEPNDDGYISSMSSYREYANRSQYEQATSDFKLDQDSFEASVVAGLHAGPLSWSNWNLECFL